MADTGTITRDPICGMTVDTQAGKPSHEHEEHLYHFCCNGCREKFAAQPADYVEAEDPVCGMKVARATARHMAKHAGERFYFCSAGCHEKFEAAPETWLGDRPAPEPMPEGTLYTCPMDPEIVRGSPATARSAAWRWSRWCRRRMPDRTRSWWISAAALPSARR